MYTANERLYRTADGRVVPENDPDCAFLLVAKGGTLSDDAAKKYGLTKKEKAEPEPETTPEPQPQAETEEKAIEAAPENKAVKSKSTK